MVRTPRPKPLQGAQRQRWVPLSASHALAAHQRPRGHGQAAERWLPGSGAPNGVSDNAQPALNVTNSEKKTLVPPSLAICLYLRHCGGFFQNRRMTRSKFFRGHVHLDAPHPHGGPSSAPVYLLSLSRVYLLLFKEMVAKDQKHFTFTCEAHWSARSAGPRASVRTLSSVPEFCCKLSGVWGHEYSSTTPAPGRMPSLGVRTRSTPTTWAGDRRPPPLPLDCPSLGSLR